jgi:transposase
MPHLTAAAKHHILLEYSPHSRTHSLAALAARHEVAGGTGTLSRWLARWDGTQRSLQEGKRPGRPRTLSSAQVSRHVRAPILAANRAHRAVSYTQLLPSVKAKTGKEPSLRTLQRHGKEELGAKQKHTKKRTAAESE